MNILSISQSLINIISRIKLSTVKINIENPEGKFRNKKFVLGGTGFIWNSEGVIVTNSHILNETKKVEVVLYNGMRYEATILGKDSHTDIAVVKIKEKNLLPIELENSETKVSPGEVIVTVGHPCGFEFSSTHGIISAINRSFRTETGRLVNDVIQLDASLDVGNSGGPVVNLDGKTIGMATIFVPEIRGLSFSISTYFIKNIVKEIILEGEIKRAYLGLSCSNFILEEKVAQINSLNSLKGVKINKILNNTPAKNSNLKKHDIIVKFDSNNLETIDDLHLLLNKEKIGHVSELTIIRKNKKIKIKIMPSKLDNKNENETNIA